MKYRYRNDEEMKDSGVEWIGKIPKDWEVKRIKYLFELKKDKSDEENPTVLSLTQKGLKIRDVSNNEGQLASTYVGYTKIEKNDFILNPMDLISGYTDKAEIEGVISPAYTTFRSKNKVNINHDYYKRYFQMHYHHNFLFPWGEGVSFEHRWTLKNEVFLNLPVITNKLEEQEKIVNFLDEKTSQFDLIISKKEELIKKLEEAKKSLISEVVTGKVKVVKNDDGYELVKRSSEEMKDSGIEWLGEIPKDWEVKRLRFLGNLQNGISKGGDQFGFGYPFVSYSNVYKNIELPSNIEGLINSTCEERKIYSVKEGDVFFTRTSETVEEIGFASTCIESIENATFSGFLIRFRPSIESLYKGFSKYYFRCDLNRKYFVKEMNLVTRASLSQNLLNNLAIALPKYKEQVEIYNALELKIGCMNLSINKLKHQIEKLKEAKKSLISEAVTGKIEILD